jgi:hypothetical protein
MYELLNCYCYTADNGEKWGVVEKNGEKHWIKIITESGYPPKDVLNLYLQDFDSSEN